MPSIPIRVRLERPLRLDTNVLGLLVIERRQLGPELVEMQAGLRAALRQKTRLAALGGAVTKINHDLRNILSTARLVSDRLLASDDPTVRRNSRALLAAIVWFLRQEPAPLQVWRRRDGKVLRLEAVTLGPEHQLVLGRRWQRLHRAIYFAAMAAPVHYFLSVKADFRQPAVYGLIVAMLLGFRVYWARTHARPPSRTEVSNISS